MTSDVATEVGRDEVRAYLSAFAADYNAGRLARMPEHYAADFTAMVDGDFVSREAYLDSITMLVEAGYADIRFELNVCRPIAPRHALANGTTTLRDPEGRDMTSRFSILCVRRGAGLQFAYTHSSAPKARP